MAYNDLNQALSGSQYTFTFDYLNEDEVKVAIDGNDPLPSDNYTLNGKTVTLNPVPSGSRIRIYRQTNLDDTEVKFASGSAIRASDLNKLSDQLLHSAQETNHTSFSRYGGQQAEANLDMGGNRITNLANAFSGEGQNTDDNGIDAYSDGDAASIGFVKHFFFDSGAETILDTDEWPADSNTTIATTKALDYRVRSELQTALNDQINTEDGITITDGTVTAGQVNPITIGLQDGGIDIEKINTSDINVAADTVYSVANNAPQATTDWANTDDQLATLAAIAKRHDGYVQRDAPTGTDHLPGTIWLSETGSSEGAAVQTINELGEKLTKYFAIWNGQEWVGVAGGGTWINQNRLIWVDGGNGDDQNDGHRVIAPMKTIQAAVNTAEDGDMIFVQPGIYSEYLPIDLGRKKNVSIIGLSMRSVFVHPNPTTRWIVDSGRDAVVNSDKVMTEGPHGGIDPNNTSSEYEVMFQLGSGSFVANMTLSGMKAQGTRGDAATDSFARNPNDANEWQGYQGWYFGFSPTADGTNGNKVKFTKSPYVQNVTCFADAGINNEAFQPHVTNLNPQDKGFGGDKSSSMTGGALIVDGSVPHQDSPLRSFLTDAFTIINLDGPGVLVRNEGYAQLVSTFGHFCHYHAKSESGGMINMSNCTTDFGRYGLIADGQSSNAIFEGTVTTLHENTKVIHVASTGNSSVEWAARGSTIPVNHMVLRFGTTYYPIRSVSENTNGGYNVELYTEVPNIPGPSSTVYFHLQSLITTGGHVFEFAGSGTDYSAHPDNGGQPNPNNQVITNDPGAVYISSTDHNGNFKVGTVFQVNSDAATTDVTGTLTVNGTMNATTVEIGGVSTKASSTFFDANDDIKDASLPNKVTAGTSTYPSSVTVDAQGRVTSISGGTEPVTAVNVSDPITGDSTSKTPTIGVKEFGGTDDAGDTILKGVVSATSSDSGKYLKGDGTWSTIPTFSGSSQAGLVSNDNSSANDTKFLRGDGNWADPTQAAFRIQLDDNEANSTHVDLELTDAATSPTVIDRVTLVPGTNVSLTRASDSVTINANSAVANVLVGSSTDLPATPTSGQLFFDIETGESYIYYSEAIPDPDNPGSNIGTDAQWIQFAPQQRGVGNGTVTRLDSGTGLEFSLDGGSTYNSSNFIQSTGHIQLANTSVTSGTYGDADSVAQFTVDQQGRITGASSVDIALGAAAVTSGTFNIDRIPDLSANKITSDTLGVDRIPNLAATKITTGTFGPLRIDRTQSLAISKIFVPAGTSDGATPPVYSGPVTVECDLANADSLLAVGDRITIASNTGNHADNQSFLNATHTITDVVAETTVNNVTTPAHFKFVIADGVGGLHNADDTANQNLGTCTWIDNGLLDANRIPGIPGERLTSGTIDANRLPSNIAKTNISTTGTWAAADIPDLSGDGSLAYTYLETVQSDLTPKLGGNLDVRSNKIVSTLNRDIKLNAHGIGAVVIEGHVDGRINTFTTDAATDSTRTPGTYILTDLSGSASGYGAAFTVTVNSDFTVQVTLTDYGNGFAQGDTITLGAASIGGGADIIVTVSGVYENQERGGKLELVGSTSSVSTTGNSFKHISFEAPAITNNLVLTLPDDIDTTLTNPVLAFANAQFTSTQKSADLEFVEQIIYTPDTWDTGVTLADRTAGLVPATGSSDTNKYLKSDGTWGAITIPTVQTFESGMIQWWPGRTIKIPDGWLICDGSVYKYATATYDSNGNVSSKSYNTFTTTAGTVINLKPLRDALSESSNESNGCIYDDQRTRTDADWKGIGTIDPVTNPAPTFTAEEYFAVPDLRGEFIRGWDDVRGVDANRNLGSAQGDQFQNHTHPSPNFASQFVNGTNQNHGVLDGLRTTTNETFVREISTSHANYNVGDETRPRNIAMIAIIKL